MTITVYDNNTGEVLACSNIESQESFSRKDIGVLIQDNTEPVRSEERRVGKEC